MSDPQYLVLDSSDASLNKTAVLVTGQEVAMVVDACFTRADAHRLVAAVLDSGKRLETVFVSAGDPDFYFGAEVLQDAFPQARFVASAATIEHIDHSYEAKLVAWAHLGANLPTRRVELTPLEGDQLTLEDASFEVRRGSANAADRGDVLWQPQTRTLLGSVLAFGGLHVWTPDMPTPELRADCVRQLEELVALEPAFVAAGHRRPGTPTDASVLESNADYLRDFEAAVAGAQTGEEAEARLVQQHPELGLLTAVQLGTKVAKGEMTWG